MKNFYEYKDEIHKCSKCGLCQSVCPIYQITGNDCAVSRGKFIMLNGVIKGDLTLNKNIDKYLDMCLKCNACRDFCPSAIDARKIFIAAKSDYFKTSKMAKLIRFVQSEIVFNSFLKFASFASNLYRKLNLASFVKLFYPLFQKFGWFGKKVILANEFVSIQGLSVEKTFLNDVDVNKDKIKVVYFKGCVNEYINPRAKIATESLLKLIGAEVIPIDFECCGVPFLSSGNVEQFKKQGMNNISKIPDDFDYFLTDCASCQSAFYDYPTYIDDESVLAKLETINSKSINVMDFILDHIKTIHFDNPTSFTFHKPCHLEDMSFIFRLLEKCENVSYKEMDDFDKCCGFSGEFAIKNTKLSTEISSKKAQNALATDADYVLTACPACVLGITQGMIENNEFAPVMNIVEFILKADKVVFTKVDDHDNADKKELVNIC